MPAYTYQARDANGAERGGRIRAETEAAAAARLQQQGLSVLWVRPAPTEQAGPAQVIWQALFPVSAGVMAALFRRLQDLFEAGFTPHDALDRVKIGMGHPRLKQAAQEMVPQLGQGAALSDLMQDYPALFRAHAVGLTRVGERSGALGAMMGEIAGHYEREARIWRSLRWPLWLLVLTVLPAPLLLVSFRYFGYWFQNQVGEGMGTAAAALHALAQFFLREGLVAVIISLLMIAGLIFAQFLLHYPGWQRVRDAMALRVPVFGQYTRVSATARFLRTFLVAHHAGCPYHEAMELGCEAAVNAEVADRIRPQIPLVREGKRMAAALDDTHLFPDTTVGVMATAEDTGKLEEAFTRAVEDVESQRDQEVKKILTYYWIHAIVWVLIISVASLALMLGALLNSQFDWVDKAFGQ
jgi:type II secretory pathway component PulF